MRDAACPCDIVFAMRNWLQKFPLLVCCFVLASAICVGQRADGYAGQYVYRVGTRNLFVLNLKESGGSLTGTLSAPAHFNLNFGSLVSAVTKESRTEPLSHWLVTPETLQFTATNPNDAKDRNDWTLRLVSKQEATLQPTGLAVEPMQFLRIPAEPRVEVAQDWNTERNYFLDDTGVPNAEMKRIADEDQKVRQPEVIAKAHWTVIAKADAVRRSQTRELLAKGELHTAEDFSHAAHVFQHGDTPDDYLLAHTLAMIAVQRGIRGAIWIGTATLDRYLNSMKQPQIYGTQFHHEKQMPWTQEPYNRGLISDALRKKLNVPVQAEQQKQLEQYEVSDTGKKLFTAN